MQLPSGYMFKETMITEKNLVLELGLDLVLLGYR